MAQVVCIYGKGFGSFSKNIFSGGQSTYWHHSVVDLKCKNSDVEFQLKCTVYAQPPMDINKITTLSCILLYQVTTNCVFLVQENHTIYLNK